MFEAQVADHFRGKRRWLLRQLEEGFLDNILIGTPRTE
jgi:hypothetical protein